jgi:hypothetical protein
MDRSLTAAEGASRRGWWLVDKPLRFHEKASKIRCRGFNPPNPDTRRYACTNQAVGHPRPLCVRPPLVSRVVNLGKVTLTQEVVTRAPLGIPWLFESKLTPQDHYAIFIPHGVTDAELQWIHPRGIPRTEQREADFSGRLVASSSSRGRGRGPWSRENEEKP